MRDPCFEEQDTQTHAARRLSRSRHNGRTQRSAKSVQRTDQSLWDYLGADTLVFSSEPDGSIPWRLGRMTFVLGRFYSELCVSKVLLHDRPHFVATRPPAADVPLQTEAGFSDMLIPQER